ncbi:hypothetical protein [Carboxylicivirga linearis]|uniref:Lipoprotein n=1 Tax=Carboxylicivirga linearis TaxID=1628157 RepID=A0ABS5K0D8_9BACT|nr:hypothetical protein [Carboxylicivirga linearis]MBS2100608.1 hypothetical protein [Carboxylicivirga linearis]
MGKIHFIILLMSVIAFSSCKSKRLVNKATKFDDAGLYMDAAQLYYQSLAANQNNIDAKLGLQRTGQLVYEDKIKLFKTQYTNGNTKDAVYAYLDADKYFNKVSVLGIKLIGQEEQLTYFEEVKDKYLGELYQSARQALSLEEFAQSESQFNEILSIDANYKDAKSQWIVSKYEPIYRRANKLYNTQLFRSSYFDFDIINKGTKGYKNSIELQQAALDNARLTIAILPMQMRSRSYQTNATKCIQSVFNGIQSISSPFYQVIDSKSIQTIKDWDQIKDANMAIQLAKKWGHRFEAKSILQTDMTRLSKRQSRLSKVEKKGYLKKTIEVTNASTNQKEKKVVYEKVRYYEYKQTSSLLMEVNYSLTRIDKDELGVSNTFSANLSDEIHYAKFDGDFKKLVPGYWKSASTDSDDDKIYDDESSIAKLHSLFKNKQTLKSTYDLEKEAYANCATQITDDLINYKPEN